MAPSALYLDRYTCPRPGKHLGFRVGWYSGPVSFYIGNAERMFFEPKQGYSSANPGDKKGAIKLDLYNNIREIGERKLGL